MDAEGVGESERDVAAPEVLDCIRTSAASYELQPVYTEASLRWLLDLYDAASYRGTYTDGLFQRRGQTA